MSVAAAVEPLDFRSSQIAIIELTRLLVATGGRLSLCWRPGIDRATRRRGRGGSLYGAGLQALDFRCVEWESKAS